MDVYRGTQGEGLKGGGWAADASPCAWQGVTCDARGRVMSLWATLLFVPIIAHEILGS